MGKGKEQDKRRKKEVGDKDEKGREGICEERKERMS